MTDTTPTTKLHREGSNVVTTYPSGRTRTLRYPNAEMAAAIMRHADHGDNLRLAAELREASSK